VPLAPEIAAALATEAALGLPAPYTQGVEAARRASATRQRPAGPAVAAVETLTIPVAGAEIAARLYRPAPREATAADPAAPAPAVVYLHGGGWVIGSLDTHDNICRQLSAGAGVVVVSVDYRMAPEHRFPVASDDCLAAVGFVAAHAARLGIDPARLVVGGDSAGGNLAAATTLRLRDEGGPALAGQLLLYPVTAHWSAGFPSYTAFAEGYGLAAAEMAWFWDLYAPTPELYRDPRAAPLAAPDLAGLPPAYVMTAECDVLRDEAEAYAARLSAAGVAVTFRRFDGLNHGCAGSFGGLACVEPFRRHVLDWLGDLVAV
jgi:acetyl esterase